MLGEIPGISVIQAHFEHVLENSLASIYWKDKNGAYLGFNNFFLENTRAPSENDVLGIKDFDLDWKNQATVLWKNDYEVICTGKSITALEFCKIDEDIIPFLSHKIPLRTRMGKIIGVFGQSLALEGKISDSVLYNEVNHDNMEVFNRCMPRAVLSSQEFTCTVLVVNGFTAKQTAKLLGISFRTVETYLNQAKIKFGVKNVKQLITNFTRETSLLTASVLQHGVCK